MTARNKRKHDRALTAPMEIAKLGVDSAENRKGERSDKDVGNQLQKVDDKAGC